MRSSKIASLLITILILCSSQIFAASVDMNDPLRAVGRENDVRVDAQLVTQVVRSGTPIAIHYQIQNLTTSAIAVAEKLCSASYDDDARTITLSLGSEIPPDGEMPKMATIAPGEKKTFSVAAPFYVTVRAHGSRVTAGPRYLQIKVNVLRNLVPFAELLKNQVRARPHTAVSLTDEQFDQWLEGNDTIFLNALPIRFEGRSRGNFDASSRHHSAGSM